MPAAVVEPEARRPEGPRQAAEAFELPDRPVDAQPHRGGHIHASWLLTCEGGDRYLLQRLNTSVFADPAALMANLVRVTAHLADAGEPTLTIISTRQGHSWWNDPHGQTWRMFALIEGTSSRREVRDRSEAEAVGLAFGRFTSSLSSLEGPPLHDVLPGLHHPRRRWAQLEAVVRADVAQRAGPAAADLAALAGFWRLVPRWDETVSAMPTRVAHNDAKADNVLLDDRTGRPRCVIDLDTVMPGCVLADLGDLLRTTAATAAEDEEDLHKVVFDRDLLAAALGGFADGAGGALTAGELAGAVFAAQALTFEQAVRFLTDHLDGDRYYRIDHPGHNLQRARTQLRLLEQLVSQEGALEELAGQIVGGQGGRSGRSFPPLG